MLDEGGVHGLFRSMVAGLALLCLEAATGGQVADSSLPGDEYLVEVWDSDRGLPHGSVTSIAQTPDGYLWVGTMYGGLARFDGDRFVTFHPGNTPEMSCIEVQRLLVDPEGTLWVGMVDGSMLSRRGGKFVFERGDPHTPQTWLGEVVAVRTNELIISSRFGWVFRALREGGSNRWQTIERPEGRMDAAMSEDREGVIWYRRQTMQLGQIRAGQFLAPTEMPGLADQQINALARDSSGRIWVGTPRELAVWEGGRFVNMCPTNEPGPVSIEQIAINGSGAIWVRTPKGFRKWSDKRWIAAAEPSAIGQRAGLRPLEMHADAVGGVWLVRFGEGLWYLDALGRLKRIGREQGLPSDLIEAFFEDHEGNVWVGLSGGGLASVRKRTFQVLWPRTGASDGAVCAVAEDVDGAIWLGTLGNRVIRCLAGEATELTLPIEQAAGTATTVCPDGRGRVWIGSVQNGAWLWESNGLSRPFPLEAVRTVARVILAGRGGRIWIGSEFGFYCWENGILKKFGAADGFEQAAVTALVEDASGNIWAGTALGELRCWGNGRFTSYRPPDSKSARAANQAKQSDETKPIGLGALTGAEEFWALHADQNGVIWIGTLGGGLLRFKDGKFTRITTRDGLPNEHVSQIAEDQKGQLWLGTRGGVTRVPKAALEQFARGEIKVIPFITYGKSDGLPTIECSGGYQPGSWRGKDGRLWFSTVKGVVWTDPRNLPANPRPPPVAIEEMWVNNRLFYASEVLPGMAAVTAARTPGKAGAALLIPPGRHNLELKFTAPSFSAPDRVRFKWRLAGGGKELSGSGVERSVRYSFLPPGIYEFHLTACNNDGVWNEAGAALAFTVQPYFWETWWFRLLAPVVLFGLIGALVMRAIRRRHRLQLERLAQQGALERERARIAQDLHDDLGASLTQIRFVGSLAGRPNTPAEEVREHIEQMRAGARTMVIALDEIVWAVNPKNDSLRALVSYLCHYAEEFLRPTGIRCRLDVPDELPDRPLASDVRHHLFLAFKEALNNVASHSAATEAQIQLTLPGRGIGIIIRDNGRGFNPAALAAPGGDGLENMRRRLEAAGGRCEVQSKPGRGTAVSFHLPPT